MDRNINKISMADNKLSVAAVGNVGSMKEMRQALLSRYAAFVPDQLERVAIVGSAGEGARFANICRDVGIEIVGIFESNTGRVGKWVAGKVVSLLESIERLDRDIPVVLASHRLLGPSDRMHYLGFRHVAPLAALQIIAPTIFPPHMFYDGWLEDLDENRDRYDDLRDALADDLSRQTLDAVINFRRSLDVEQIRPLIDWEVYNPDGLIRLADDEVYVDGGAYEGDTINLFIDRVDGRYERALGFEPDTATYENFKANFAGEPRVEPINRGLYDHTGTLRFDDAGTRGSIIVDSGGVEIKVTSLDEVLDGDRVTYIKMNIEGAELKALEGARQSIAQWQPKLAISAYHRPTDLWEIPALIRSLHLDYKLYLRQHDGGVIETVIYAL